MAAGKQKVVVGAVVVVLLVGAAAAAVLFGRDAGPITVEGVITFVDAESREAAVECRHPDHGNRIETAAKIPPSCEITINDKPATLGDVRAGDHALITVEWERRLKKKGIHPLRIEVTRDRQELSSAPATG